LNLLRRIDLRWLRLTD